jgi:hypothetical protein
MAIAGGGLPSIIVRIHDGALRVEGTTVNRPKEIICSDVDEAYTRLIVQQEPQLTVSVTDGFIVKLKRKIAESQAGA